MNSTLVTPNTSPRDTQAWYARGLLTLYGFAIATLIAAAVTFVAHNWTYLSTGVKLGGLGTALFICAIVWIRLKFESRTAQIFGIVAQVLIGVWLAAAGQIYQAPGGLQDLLLVWAVLGLPFALASRSSSHWAVWFGVVYLAALSTTGLRLLSFIGPDHEAVILLVGALILSVGYLVSLSKSAPIWLMALLAIGIGTLCIQASWRSLFDNPFLSPIGAPVFAVLILGGLATLTYSRQIMSTTAIIATAVTVVVLSTVGYILAETVDEAFLFFFLMTTVACGTTYSSVLFFKHLLRTFGTAGEAVGPSEDTPWYMDALIGAGGVVTAVFASGLIATTIGLSGLLEDNWGMSLLIIGAVVYGLSIVMRYRLSGNFMAYLFGTFILVGIACISAGLGEVLSDLVPAGVALIVLSAATVWLMSKDPILSGLMAVTICVGFLFLVFDQGLLSTQLSILMIAYTLIGLALGSFPFKDRLHLGMASLFLIAAIATGLFSGVDMGRAEGLNWFVINVTNVSLAAIGGLWLWWCYCRTVGPSWPILLVLVGISIVLPLGAVPAMLLLILAFGVGSRALFLIGVLAMVWFLFSAYFDLSMTLMALSGVMTVTGLALLGLWVFARRRVELMT